MKKFLIKTRNPYPLLKYDLKVKISTLFIFVAILTMQANSYSQLTKITLDLENVSVERFIDETEHNTEFRFVYKTKDVDLGRFISIKVEKEQIAKILNRVFKNTKTAFAIADTDRLIHLTKRTIGLHTKPILEQSPEQQTLQFTINGKVTDKNDRPLPGASIVEKGTSNGTTTDFDGDFYLTVEDENAVLVISYIGFSTMEVAVNGQENIAVTLLEDSAKLEEVVVVGYGSQKKANLTGAVVSIKGDDINKRPITQGSQALQGVASGVFVNTNSGEPGVDDASVNIRGIGTLNDSKPLVLIDGIEGPLNSINPNDIESVNVLKDAASASIYGTRAANGVMLITKVSEILIP